jgi:hypothetical protein
MNRSDEVISKRVGAVYVDFRGAARLFALTSQFSSDVLQPPRRHSRFQRPASPQLARRQLSHCGVRERDSGNGILNSPAGGADNTRAAGTGAARRKNLKQLTKWGTGLVMATIAAGALSLSHRATTVTAAESWVTSAPAAASYGIWTPSRFDTCTKAQHDAYFVIGPDGKKYPTWHPPIDPVTGCSFGHEHGRDPKQSVLWQTKQIQQYFYFDANRNGVMDPAEEAVAGLPFGYAAERTNEYMAAKSIPTHRHEDHVGHKVEFANGEPDLATHQMSNLPNGGVWIGKLGNGVVQNDTGARCFFLAKVHQGVTTADAFTNNLHEVFYFAACTHANRAYQQQISIAEMVPFGSPGEFSVFEPMCGRSARGTAARKVVLGVNAMNKLYPSGPGVREIITRECVEYGFLVPDGRWSGNFYEAWPGTLRVATNSGRELAGRVNLLFDVEDAARYYYPDTVKAIRGYTNTEAGPNRGFSMDLCYDMSLARAGRRARGGVCDWATKYGTIAGITWDDPRSGFRGLHRGMYFTPAVLDNATGPEVWYTDPFGTSAKTQPFPGSIRQHISQARMNYSTFIGGIPIDPRVVDRVHADGEGRVHAPN